MRTPRLGKATQLPRGRPYPDGAGAASRGGNFVPGNAAPPTGTYAAERVHGESPEDELRDAVRGGQDKVPKEREHLICTGERQRVVSDGAKPVVPRGPKRTPRVKRHERHGETYEQPSKSQGSPFHRDGAATGPGQGTRGGCRSLQRARHGRRGRERVTPGAAKTGLDPPRGQPGRGQWMHPNFPAMERPGEAQGGRQWQRQAPGKGQEAAAAGCAPGALALDRRHSEPR